MLLQGFKRETRFTSKSPANEIISKIEEAAKPLGFDVHKKNYKVRKIEQIQSSTSIREFGISQLEERKAWDPFHNSNGRNNECKKSFLNKNNAF